MKFLRKMRRTEELMNWRTVRDKTVYPTFLCGGKITLVCFLIIWNIACTYDILISCCSVFSLLWSVLWNFSSSVVFGHGDFFDHKRNTTQNDVCLGFTLCFVYIEHFDLLFIVLIVEVIINFSISLSSIDSLSLPSYQTFNVFCCISLPPVLL